MDWNERLKNVTMLCLCIIVAMDGDRWSVWLMAVIGVVTLIEWASKERS